MFFLDIWGNLWIVFSLIYLIWLFAWAKRQLGSVTLSVLFAVIVVYLTFFQYPWLVWVPVVLFLFAFFFRGMFEKLPEGEKKPDYLRY